MNILKLIGKILFLIILVLLVTAVIKFFVSSAINSYNETSSGEDTYMGLSRQEYLDEVSNNGQDTAALCSYTYLIDTYGLKETYSMDYRASKDETDVDPRIFEAMDRCVE